MQSAKDVESIPSLKKNSRRFGDEARTRSISGASISIETLYTELTRPGVPPSNAFEAIQLSSSEQGSFGLISSREKPPSLFISSRYQSSV